MGLIGNGPLGDGVIGNDLIGDGLVVEGLIVTTKSWRVDLWVSRVEEANLVSGLELLPAPTRHLLAEFDPGHISRSASDTIVVGVVNLLDVDGFDSVEKISSGVFFVGGIAEMGK